MVARRGLAMRLLGRTETSVAAAPAVSDDSMALGVVRRADAVFHERCNPTGAVGYDHPR
jgi:hypothetical protein